MINFQPLLFWISRLALLSSVVLLLACGSTESDEPKQTDKPKQTVDPAPARSTLELATLDEKELADGWISLFDGQSLYGWQPHGEANWSVEDKSIVVSSGEKSLLCTTTQFDNYVLRVDFRADPKTNSGLFLRTEQEVGPDDVTTKCYELNIAPPDNPFPTGSLVKRKKAEGEFKSDDWQTFEVTVDDADVIVKLGGETILEYHDPKPIGRGLIGLQHNEGKVAFRNIKLKPLGLKSIFNGKDLNGWKDDKAAESDFAVTDDGELNVTNGRGQLESNESYGDFVLQLECIAHAKDLNSGIFFRCIPGDVMMGYESQIHNGFKDGDRTRPKDWGTGAIFKQHAARIVAADDLKWFHKTLIADGRHVSVWINGMQVTDWTDEREPNENPRKGRRVEPGTIMIQGHDPTTNLSFRKLRISEMAKNEP